MEHRPAFMASAGLAPATLGKYRRVVCALRNFALARNALNVNNLTVEVLDQFRSAATRTAVGECLYFF
jgi:hypothetical protein